jgi:hypothetical protein
MLHQSREAKGKEQDWTSRLSVPFRTHNRDVTEYPDSVLGELAYRFRELYWRDYDTRRPSGGHLAQTAHLVGLLSQEFDRVPLYRRSEEELQLINYLVTPRTLWREAQPFHHAVQAIVGDALVRDAKLFSALFGRAWRGKEASVATYYLHQIAIHLCTCERRYDDVVGIVRSAAPSPGKYAVSAALAGGAFALLAVSAELGDRRAMSLLLTSGLEYLCGAETVDRLFVVDPLSRQTEYRFASYFFSDLLRATVGVAAKKTGSCVDLTEDELLDITRSWLEGSHFPVTNFLGHSAALRCAMSVSTFQENYRNNGIRNFKRLELTDCDDPWFLARYLAERSPTETAGGDVILVAAGSGDHNDAFSARGWEFEGIRSAGYEQGWSFDYVEVRDSTELAYHILRHHQQGSRVAVLHHLGHGSHVGAEYGRLEREGRSEIALSKVFTDPEHRELCSIAKEAVDTWVLHHCSTAARTPSSARKISNLSEAIYEATDGRVTVTGLRGHDAFDELRHVRDTKNRVRFTGKPVWTGAAVLKGQSKRGS